MLTLLNSLSPLPPQIRQDLGVCPQFNVLFEHLTVEEHLWFFASLKRTPAANVREEVETFLKSVGLEDKGGSFAHELSGVSMWSNVLSMRLYTTVLKTFIVKVALARTPN